MVYPNLTATMKTILFPTDFTEAATPALNWARLFARQYKATLVLVHVQPQPMPDPSFLTAGDMNPGLTMPVETGAIESVDREQLTKLAAQLQSEGINCQTDFRWGAVKEGILSAADEHRADLIITGRGQLTNFFERLVGTEATGVVREAHCPVLVVPTGDTRPVQLKTIVFATPMAVDQRTEFSQLVDLAQTFGATVSALTVQAQNQPDVAANPVATASLQTLADGPLHTEQIQAPTVTEGITDYLTSHQPDLLVMTTIEHDFLSGLFNPSQTDRMVILTETPILVYRALSAV